MVTNYCYPDNFTMYKIIRQAWTYSISVNIFALPDLKITDTFFETKLASNLLKFLFINHSRQRYSTSPKPKKLVKNILLEVVFSTPLLSVFENVTRNGLLCLIYYSLSESSPVILVHRCVRFVLVVHRLLFGPKGLVLQPGLWLQLGPGHDNTGQHTYTKQ